MFFSNSLVCSSYQAFPASCFDVLSFVVCRSFCDAPQTYFAFCGTAFSGPIAMHLSFSGTRCICLRDDCVVSTNRVGPGAVCRTTAVESEAVRGATAAAVGPGSVIGAYIKWYGIGEGRGGRRFRVIAAEPNCIGMAYMQSAINKRR